MHILGHQEEPLLSSRQDIQPEFSPFSIPKKTKIYLNHTQDVPLQTEIAYYCSRH